MREVEPLAPFGAVFIRVAGIHAVHAAGLAVGGLQAAFATGALRGVLAARAVLGRAELPPAWTARRASSTGARARRGCCSAEHALRFVLGWTWAAGLAIGGADPVAKLGEV